MAKQSPVTMEELYALKPSAIWRQFKSEHWSFWMICGYLFVEYVRPQSIRPSLDFLPWGQLLLILSLIGLFFESRRKWVGNPANKWMLAFLVIMVISSVNAYFPEVSWAKFKNLYSWVIVYFLVINLVSTKERLFIFLILFFLASFKISFFAARAWASRGFSMSGWALVGPPGYFENPGELAIQMLVFAPVAYQFGHALKPYLSRIKYYVVMFFPLTAWLAVIGAGSRGAQLSLIHQIFYVFIRGKITFGRILLVCIGLYVAYLFVPQEGKERFMRSGKDETSIQRLLYWEHGLEMIAEHPLTGVGFYNFPRYYEKYYPQDLLRPRAELPHNIFIQIGTDGGIPGLLVYLMLVYKNFSMLSAVRRKSADLKNGFFYRSLANGLSAACWGYLIAGQFVTVTYYPFFWMNLAFSVVLKHVVDNEVIESKRGSA